MLLPDLLCCYHLTFIIDQVILGQSITQKQLLIECQWLGLGHLTGNCLVSSWLAHMASVGLIHMPGSLEPHGWGWLSM